MKPKFITIENSFIIPAIPLSGKLIHLTIYVLPVLIVFLVWYYKFIATITLVVMLIFIGSILFHFFKFPANFNPIILKKDIPYFYIGKKKINFEDLLFLSLREKDAYRVIRLEAKRENILISNEIKLFTNCKNFEEALYLCRQVRDFIDPNLKINHITIGNSEVNSGYGNYTSGGGRNEDVEVWTYIN